jgi:hypothetical protein
MAGDRRAPGEALAAPSAVPAPSLQNKTLPKLHKTRSLSVRLKNKRTLDDTLYLSSRGTRRSLTIETMKRQLQRDCNLQSIAPRLNDDLAMTLYTSGMKSRKAVAFCIAFLRSR